MSMDGPASGQNTLHTYYIVITKPFLILFETVFYILNKPLDYHTLGIPFIAHKYNY